MIQELVSDLAECLFIVVSWSLTGLKARQKVQLVAPFSLVRGKEWCWAATSGTRRLGHDMLGPSLSALSFRGEEKGGNKVEVGTGIDCTWRASRELLCRKHKARLIRKLNLNLNLNSPIGRCISD